MHLIGSPASPFIQRCAIVARAKGLDIGIAPPPGGMQSPEFQAISPMGRIPILQLDDGDTICESSAIAAYLDETLPGPGLVGGTPRERARIREIEAVTICEIATGMRPVIVHRIFRFGENEPLVAAGIAQADRGCVALARLIADAPYAAGQTLSRADATLTPIAALTAGLAREPEVAAMMERHPVLHTYLERAATDPVLARSIREMREGFAAIVARVTQAVPA